MDETEKLRVLLPHWIEHNGEHAQEFRDYAERSGRVKDQLLAAARCWRKPTRDSTMRWQNWAIRWNTIPK